MIPRPPPPRSPALGLVATVHSHHHQYHAIQPSGSFVRANSDLAGNGPDFSRPADFSVGAGFSAADFSLADLRMASNLLKQNRNGYVSPTDNSEVLGI